MKKAFTITELLVAVVVLAIAMVAMGGIFKMAIDSQRTASATSEVMRNLRAITDQINADFEGFRPEPITAVAFYVVDPNTGDPNDRIRADRIIFFANGDFQSTRQYPYGGGSGFKTVVGNVARIWYGQSAVPDPNSPDELIKREKLLLRRVQILTADSSLIDQTKCDPNNSDDTREYDVRSLAEWEVFQKLDMPDPNTAAFRRWIGRPSVDLTDPNFIPMIMAKGVDDFTVQLSNWDTGQIRWWPTNDEVGDDYPGGFEAIRFVFTLYDSRGILEGGRRFSHVVYLEDKF